MRWHIFAIGRPKLDFARLGIEEYAALAGAPGGPRTFTFRYQAAARDLRYIVQRNADLTNAAGWTEIYRLDTSTGQITELFSVTGDENATTQVITLTDPATSLRLFWRLRLERVP